MGDQVEEACEYEDDHGCKVVYTDRILSQCAMGVYPFMFSATQDFEPIVEKLVEVGRIQDEE